MLLVFGSYLARFRQKQGSVGRPQHGYKQIKQKRKILLGTQTLNCMCRQGNIEMSLDLYWTGVIAVYDPHEIQ